jgi:hypothetical protein
MEEVYATFWMILLRFHMSVHGYIKKRIFSSDCVLDYSKYVSGVIVTALSK